MFKLRLSFRLVSCHQPLQKAGYRIPGIYTTHMVYIHVRNARVIYIYMYMYVCVWHVVYTSCVRIALKYCRSPSQFRPDESGISSEEGCHQQPVYATLSNIATLFSKLEKTLEPLSEQVDDGGDVTGGGPPAMQLSRTPSPDIVVLGPPGTQPQSGKTRARYDSGTSVVYSRNSSQFFTHGKIPAPALVMCKDSCGKRRATVAVALPTESAGDRRWTRAGTRAITKAHPLRMNYFEESGASSEYSSSEGESGVVRTNIQRKKRVRRKKQGSKGGHSYNSDREGVSDTHRSTPSADDENTEPVSQEYTTEAEEDGLDGGVQMECEIGEDSESPKLMLSLPAPQAETCKSPSLHPSLGVPVVTTPSGIYTVYDDLNNVVRPSKMRYSGKERKSMQRTAVSGRNKCRTKLRQCSVNITRLPRHVVNHYLPTLVKKSVSFCNNRISRQDSSGSVSSTSSTSCSSDSVSILQPHSHAVFTTPEHWKVAGGRGGSGKLTPRRLGDGGRSPVAKRSVPFSKPPHTLKRLSSAAVVERAHSTAPTRSPSYAALTKSPATPAKSPSHPVASVGTTAKASTPTTTLALSSQTSTSGTCVATMPVDWSSDDDFKVNPRPSFVLSPAAQRATRNSSSSSPLVKKERDAGASSELSPQTTSESLPNSRQPAPRVSDSSESNVAVSVAGNSGDAVCNKTHSPSPVKAVAHSMTEDTADTGTV